jgi:hypothetical protein
MGVPTSEVGYTSATTGRRVHQVHKGHLVALEKKININTQQLHGRWGGISCEVNFQLVTRIAGEFFAATTNGSFAKQVTDSLKFYVFLTCISKYAYNSTTIHYLSSVYSVTIPLLHFDVHGSIHLGNVFVRLKVQLDVHGFICIL